MRLFSFIAETLTDALRLARNPREGIKSLYGVSLYRNAGYLMANSGAGAVLGFVFWIVVARLYSVEDVGLGSALLSAAGLLASIGTLGLGISIIRYLPNSNDKAQLLNSFFTFAGLFAMLIAFIFLAGLPLWSPKLMFVYQHPVFLSAFIIFVVVNTLNLIMASGFVAFRRAEFVFAQLMVHGPLRLILVAGLALSFGVFGIFASWGVAVTVAFGVSLLFFLPRLLPRYRPIPSFSLSFPSNPQPLTLGELMRFSLTNYLSSMLWSLPSWILPLTILHILSPKDSAYFYVAWAMAGLLVAASGALSSSLFAEGSYIEEKVNIDLRKSLKFILLTLVPAILVFVLVGNKLLLLFGKEYSLAGTPLLWLLALASLPGSINLLYLSIARVEKRLKEVIWVSASIALGTLVISYFLLPPLGILGAGIGWLTTQAVVAFIISIMLARRLKYGKQD